MGRTPRRGKAVAIPGMAALLSGCRILMVVPPRDFRDEELFVPKGCFETEGAAVDVASTVAGPAQGTLGAVVMPPAVVTQADPASYAAVIVVGGAGTPDALWDHGGLHAFLRVAFGGGAVVGASCAAAVVLAHAGLLRGVRATAGGDPRARKELVRTGARFINDDVIVDGRIVTASSHDAARAFAGAVVRVVHATRQPAISGRGTAHGSSQHAADPWTIPSRTGTSSRQRRAV